MIQCSKCTGKVCKYVSKKLAKKKRKGIHQILQSTMKDLKDQEEIGCGFSPRIVGSAKRNMIVRHGGDLFDTDIQIEYMGKKAKDFSNDFKDLFHTTMKSHFPDDGKWTSEISTSVITINKTDDEGAQEHSFDLAIVRKNGDDFEINRGKVIDTTSPDSYRWEKMGNINSAYNDWKGFNKIKQDDVKQRYINKRCDRRGKDKDDNDYKSSSSLFIESINDSQQ